MVIDEHKEHILTNYKKARKGEKVVDSDHYTEYMDVDLKLLSQKPHIFFLSLNVGELLNSLHSYHKNGNNVNHGQ